MVFNEPHAEPALCAEMKREAFNRPCSRGIACDPVLHGVSGKPAKASGFLGALPAGRWHPEPRLRRVVNRGCLHGRRSGSAGNLDRPLLPTTALHPLWMAKTRFHACRERHSPSPQPSSFPEERRRGVFSRRIKAHLRPFLRASPGQGKTSLLGPNELSVTLQAHPI